MIKIEMHFPDFAAAAEAMLRMAGTPPTSLNEGGPKDVFVQMTPADAPTAAIMPETLASPNYRLIGSAGDGRTRRTKAEVAEDEELTALGAGFGMSADVLNASILNHGRNVVRQDLAESGQALPSANISTAPEDRQDPENPEPDDSVAPLTEDDVRNAVRAAMLRIGQVKTAEIMIKTGGAQSVTKIPPANYRRLIEALAQEPANG